MKIKLVNLEVKFDVVDLGNMDFLRLDEKVAGKVLILKNKEIVSADRSQGLYALSDQMYAKQVEDFITRGLSLYRGIPRWHATWHDVQASRPLTALGKGDYPDFSTNNSTYIPFTALQEVAVKAAISRSGMGPKDKLEFVEGYRKDLTFPVGSVVSYLASKARDAVGFCNATEVQVKGPIIGWLLWVDSNYHMGTPLTNVFGERAAKSHSQEIEEFIKTGNRNDLASVMPDVPTEAEKQAYIRQHGRLLR